MSLTNREDTIKENDYNIEMEQTATDENKDSLPNNIVEKELQSVLKPVNVIEALFFCAKYKIWNNKITTNCILYNIFSPFFTSVLMCYTFYAWFGFPIKVDHEGFPFFQHLYLIHVYVLLFFASFLNCFTNIVQKHNNVCFVLKIQNIYKILQINDSFKQFIVPYWVSFFMLNFYQIIWIFYSYFIFDLSSRGFNISSYFWIVNDNNMFYATGILKLLTKPLKRWVTNVKMIDCVAITGDQCYWSLMFEVYIEILKAYKIYKKTCQHLILFFITQTVLKSLCCITICIEIRKVTTEIETSYIYAVLSFMSLSWIIKNMLLLIFLSVESERFYSALRDVQSTCIQLSNSRGSSDTQKRVCKNIQRIQTASFKKMHACGLFIIDAAMPLSLCALITTYTIVILQFEFL